MHTTPTFTRPLGVMLRQFKCWLGLHRLCVSSDRICPREAACLHCGARFHGIYDMATGETIWRPK